MIGQMRPQVLGAVRAMRHRGDTVSCPCCDGTFDRFTPHRTRPFARCPRCGSLERHRLLIGFLRERTDLFTTELSVLHVAPEYAIQRRLRAQGNLRYRSADLESPLAMDKVDLLHMPYADGAFDVVMCNHVLEHVDDDRRALREMRRVLAPAGRAIIMSPIDEDLAETVEDPTVVTPQERDRVFGQSDHLRRYGRDFAQRVAAEGFDVQAISYIDSLSEQDIARRGLRRESELFTNDDVFVCTRTDGAGNATTGSATT
jgi:SAM-dependent methyltransferase